MTTFAADKTVFREYSEAELADENRQVFDATAIERDWIERAEAVPYATDEEILQDVRDGKLLKVAQGTSYIARKLLRDWAPERSNPSHPEHYSPPYLGVQAAEIMEGIAERWQEEMGTGRFLSVPSVVRSLQYQRELAKRPDALTIKDPAELSSHTVGWAFDVDACGIFEKDDHGDVRAINPRSSGFNSTLVAESRLVLRHLLFEYQGTGKINFVEELPESMRHCFHVCVKPVELV